MLSTHSVRLESDTQYYPTKTPARSHLRNENAYNHGSMTVQNGKGKPLLDSDAQYYPAKTPARSKLHNENAHKHGATTTQNAKGKYTRPLADKTPFTNRVLNIYTTPLPNKKSIVLTTKTHGPTSECGSARASSGRKHSRVPTSVANNFHALANQENHWNIDDGGVRASETEQAHQPTDDNDEMEYGPSTALNLPYQPPFDFELPDYRILGKEALRSVYCHPYEATPPPTYEFLIGDNDFMAWDTLSLSLLDAEDETSRPTNRIRGTSKQTISKSNRPVSSQALTRASSRPATSRFPTSTNKLSSNPTTTPINRPRSATALTLKPNPKSSTTTAQSSTRPSVAARSLSVPGSERPLTATSARTVKTFATVSSTTKNTVEKPQGGTRPLRSTGTGSAAVPNARTFTTAKREFVMSRTGSSNTTTARTKPEPNKHGTAEGEQIEKLVKNI